MPEKSRFDDDIEQLILKIRGKMESDKCAKFMKYEEYKEDIGLRDIICRI
ncbi:MAG: hypothetical protein LBF56_02040 [Holosporales bacterium]|jgi:hypothetical protein|nr:hypothetical protein [Holosporales bacterium]